MSNSQKETTELMTHEEQKAVYDAQAVLAGKSNILMRIGQIQGFNMVAKHATVAEILIFREIRNSKEYKGLPYLKNGKTLTVGTLEEFCPAFLNRSYTTMDELDKNLEAFGQEFFEQAQHLGLGYRELRKLRAIPEDERLQVLEHDALESGDKDVIREVIDDLHAKHKQEKRDLNDQLNDTQADLAATRKLNTDQAQREEELMVKLEKAKYRPEQWPEHAKDLVEQTVLASGQSFTGLDALDQLFTHIDTLTDQYADATQVRHYAVKVYVHNLQLVAERAAMLLMNAREYFPELDEPKPAEEVLAELDAMANEKDYGTKAE